MEIESKENWHILSGNEKYGPYDYKQLIYMIQTNELMDYSYVWAPHMAEWAQVHTLKEFSADRFSLLKKESEFKDAFIERRNSRTTLSQQVIGHNNTYFFDGQLTSISENGALCLLNSPLVQIGDKLKLHIKTKVQGETPFNVEAVVIRKNFTKERLNTKSGLFYVLKFVDVYPTGMDQIKSWIKKSGSVQAI